MNHFSGGVTNEWSPLGLFAGEDLLRLEYHDTVPAVLAVFGLLILLFAGIYGLHSSMQPTILKNRGILHSSSSPPASGAAAPESETRSAQAPQRERQVRAHTVPARNAGPSYGALL
jgi:hypothetical protein